MKQYRWVVGEGHSSNRNTANLQECPSKAPAPDSGLLRPYHTPHKPLCGLWPAAR
jgi:hypothetical protein